ALSRRGGPHHLGADRNPPREGVGDGPSWTLATQELHGALTRGEFHSHHRLGTRSREHDPEFAVHDEGRPGDLLETQRDEGLVSAQLARRLAHASGITRGSRLAPGEVHRELRSAYRATRHRTARSVPRRQTRAAEPTSGRARGDARWHLVAPEGMPSRRAR